MAATGEFTSSLVNIRDVPMVQEESRQRHRPLLPNTAQEQSTVDPSASRPDTTTVDEVSAPREGEAGKQATENSGSSPKEGAKPEQRGDASTPFLGESTEAPSVETGSGVLRRPTFETGYHFPPKYNWKESLYHGLRVSWDYFTTPLGFCVVIYGLNVVAWGGMLFLLLCNASPAMCYPTCDDIDSPRRKWIEWDSQIINALFCVTGFGLAPWRFRDWYYLLQYRVLKRESGLRRLAGINRTWFRLQGSQDFHLGVGPQSLPDDAASSSRVPYPPEKMPDPPPTGIRAPPTAMWRLDFVVWCMVCNTFLQAVLSAFMWGMDRYTRPSWSTGLFVALACIVAAMGGIMMFTEGKKVKSIEGVPLSQRDLDKLAQDKEMGITHYNNLKDKKPKAKNTKAG